MLNNNTLSTSMGLKILSFSLGAAFTFSAPKVLSERYDDFVQLLSIIAFASVCASYGSAGFLMRNYKEAKNKGHLATLYHMMLQKKIIVYFLLIVIMAFLGHIRIAPLVILIDLSLVASLILYANEEYIRKQLYIPVQAFIKLAFLPILNGHLFFYILTFFLLPRIYLFRKLYCELKEFNPIKVKQLDRTLFIQNERLSYLSNASFYFLLHSPILLGVSKSENEQSTLSFTFSFALFLVFYGVISTINEVILPTAIKMRDNKNKITTLLFLSFPLGIFYFIVCTGLTFYLAVYLRSDYFHGITYEQIIWMLVFFTSIFILNGIRQYLFSLDKLHIWMIAYLGVAVAALCLMLTNVVDLSNAVLILPGALILVMITFISLHVIK